MLSRSAISASSCCDPSHSLHPHPPCAQTAVGRAPRRGGGRRWGVAGGGGARGYAPSAGGLVGVVARGCGCVAGGVRAERHGHAVPVVHAATVRVPAYAATPPRRSATAARPRRRHHPLHALYPLHPLPSHSTHLIHFTHFTHARECVRAGAAAVSPVGLGLGGLHVPGGVECLGGEHQLRRLAPPQLRPRRRRDGHLRRAAP
jgi:hypothetical protein